MKSVAKFFIILTDIICPLILIFICYLWSNTLNEFIKTNDYVYLINLISSLIVFIFIIVLIIFYNFRFILKIDKTNSTIIFNTILKKIIVNENDIEIKKNTGAYITLKIKDINNKKRSIFILRQCFDEKELKKLIKENSEVKTTTETKKDNSNIICHKCNITFKIFLYIGVCFYIIGLIIISLFTIYLIYLLFVSFEFYMLLGVFAVLIMITGFIYLLYYSAYKYIIKFEVIENKIIFYTLWSRLELENDNYKIHIYERMNDYAIKIMLNSKQYKKLSLAKHIFDLSQINSIKYYINHLNYKI